jgi:UDP-glucose 4-epimerase
MKKVLITGASGFIGSYLKEHLTGYEISTLSLREPNWKRQPIDADVVIHCAGLAHSKKSLPRERYMDVNCYLTKELIEHSLQHNVSHFIFLSTMLVYGEGHIGPIAPTSLIHPVSDYAASKLCAEEVISSNKNIQTTIVRLPLVFGDKGKGNLASLRRFATVSPLFLKINNSRSILMIDDLVKIIHEVILHQSTGIILPSSKTVSTSDLYILLRYPKRYYLMSFPIRVTKFLRRFNGVMAKLFGDCYYEKSNSIPKEELT